MNLLLQKLVGATFLLLLVAACDARENEEAEATDFALVRPLWKSIQQASRRARTAKLFEKPDGMGSLLCNLENSNQLPAYHSSGDFLMVSCNGGLLQQRQAVINAVTLARYLNVTLIVPRLAENLVWRDQSRFGDLFDYPHFKEKLRGIISITTRIPPRHSMTTVRVPSNDTADFSWYSQNVLPIITAGRHHGPNGTNNRARIVLLKPFARRLSSRLPAAYQQLRCFVSHHALRFSPRIRLLAGRIIQVLRSMTGSFIALHMRYEVDAVAYSMCSFGGGYDEEAMLQEYRRQHWDTVLRKDRRKLQPLSQRLKGQCPLSPLEAAIFLRSLGFKNDTVVYVAAMADQIYGGSSALDPLRRLYPKAVLKSQLVSVGFNWTGIGASTLAAVDYEVCVSSDVFVPTATGNFPNFVLGTRILMGYRKTVQPRLKRVAQAFRCLSNSPVSEVLRVLRREHHGRDGGPVPRRGLQNFFSNPTECMCGSTNVFFQGDSRPH